ncbi:MAG TPA: ABC transporter substrate-binding protein [Rhodocyclaceae bacterium]|nr:ABC transporter substrate-binding protein [Rhodocyclaceae bacterium]
MTFTSTKLRTALTAATLMLTSTFGQAADTIKVGLLAPYSGPFADYGKQFEGGMRAYLKQNGDTVAGKKIELITRDTTGPAPELGKRLAQELVVRDQVDFLVVGGFTPETMTAGAVATAAKKPLLILNSASGGLTEKIPYGVRVGYSFPQITKPLGTWAAKHGYKKIVTLVPDYGPGIDTENSFKAAFTAAGGQVIESIRVPLKNPEFAPYIQRIKDAKPDALFSWVPAGEEDVALLKAYYERELDKAGIKLICLGDGLDQHAFGSLGDKLKGVVSSLHYSLSHNSPENKKFIKAFADANGPALEPTFMAVAAYDATAAIFEAVKKQNGNVDGTKSLEIMSNLQIESPRGKITINPATRDVTQTVYIRRVEKNGNKLENIEFEPVVGVLP